MSARTVVPESIEEKSNWLKIVFGYYQDKSKVGGKVYLPLDAADVDPLIIYLLDSVKSDEYDIKDTGIYALKSGESRNFIMYKLPYNGFSSFGIPRSWTGVTELVIEK